MGKSTIVLNAESERLTKYIATKVEGSLVITKGASLASADDLQDFSSSVTAVPLSWVVDLPWFGEMLAEHELVVVLPDPALRSLETVQKRVLASLRKHHDFTDALEMGVREPITRSDYAARLEALDDLGLTHQLVILGGLRPRPQLARMLLGDEEFPGWTIDVSRSGEPTDWDAAIKELHPEFMSGPAAEILAALRERYVEFQKKMQQRVAFELPWIATPPA